MEIFPNDASALTAKADLFQVEGRLEEAAKELAPIPKDSTDNYTVLVSAYQVMLERRFDAAVTAIE